MRKMLRNLPLWLLFSVLLPMTVSAAGTNPYTGDEFNLTLWVSLMGISLVAAVVVAVLLLKKKK